MASSDVECAPYTQYMYIGAQFTSFAFQSAALASSSLTDIGHFVTTY